MVEHSPSDQLLALDEALTRLAVEDPQKAELVNLRYFAGMTVGSGRGSRHLPRNRRSVLDIRERRGFTARWRMPAMSDILAESVRREARKSCIDL